MALVGRIGRKIISGRGFMGAGVTAASLYGFGQGVTSQTGDLSSQLYEITTGNPNIDEDVFGTNMGARELFMPILPPRPPVAGTMTAGATVGAAVGGFTGFKIGSGLMRRGGRGAILRGMFGAAVGMGGAGVGAVAGGAAGVAGAVQERERKLVFNPQMISRMQTDQRNRATQAKYGSSLPYVSGDMVFGQYNFRGGSQ